jgi:hypothetical protein
VAALSFVSTAADLDLVRRVVAAALFSSFSFVTTLRLVARF